MKWKKNRRIRKVIEIEDNPNFKGYKGVIKYRFSRYSKAITPDDVKEYRRNDEEYKLFDFLTKGCEELILNEGKILLKGLAPVIEFGYRGRVFHLRLLVSDYKKEEVEHD
jgi:hypothetical protein